MNNARLWLVVNPTVGIPALLGAVAIGSFSVHVGIVTNTTWVEDFLSGRDMGSTDASAAVSTETQNASVEIDGAQVVFKKSADGATQQAVVLFDDGRVGKVVFDEPVQTAALSDAEIKSGAKP